MRGGGKANEEKAEGMTEKGNMREERGKMGRKKGDGIAKMGQEMERKDSQSMKQFDNLVILLPKSISSQRPAI